MLERIADRLETGLLLMILDEIKDPVDFPTIGENIPAKNGRKSDREYGRRIGAVQDRPRRTCARAETISLGCITAAPRKHDTQGKISRERLNAIQERGQGRSSNLLMPTSIALPRLDPGLPHEDGA